MDIKSSEVQITLKNGEKVKVNDHVYCSPAWSIRDGTPYSVARIMEFLPPEDKTTTRTPRKGKSRETTVYTRARLAWYYRPSDVSDRAVADSRLLLAAIYSEICDISQLRAKCYVIHKDKLANVTEWKRKPDRFYFHRLFDPYIKKEFEVLLSTDVRNLPQHIRDVLISRYEYIVAEKEVVPDLTDVLRLCKICDEWCAHLDTVQCASCKDYYHMLCVVPPVLAKPSRGYGWTCAKCSSVNDRKVDARGMPASGTSRESTPRGVALTRGGRGRGRPRRDKVGTVSNTGDDEMQVKHYKLWPFRYFGLYTVAEDTLDPDDLIFPRAATRVGPKYQATVPSRPGEPIPSSTSTSTTLSTILGEIPERGGDSTIEVLSIVNEFESSEVAQMEMAMKKCIVREKQKSSVDFLTEFVRRVCDARANRRSISTVSMKSVNRLERWKKHETRYTDREWTDEEVAAFEDGISQYGAELRSVKDEVGTRSMPEVVRFYGHWKNSRLGEENARLREPDAYKKAKVPRSPTSARPSNGISDNDEDDDESIVNVPPSAQGPRNSNFCAACRTRDSRVWWKAPKGLTTSILCDTCGVNWRKYADLNARPTTREETAMSTQATNAANANGNNNSSTPAKNREKREGTPLTAPAAKRTKVAAGVASSVSAKSTPPPVLNLSAQYQCVSCYRHDSLGKVLKCKGCGVTLHAGACGSESMKPEDVENWICELCENEKTQEYSLNTSCLLCPREGQGAKNGAAPTTSYLMACKPTEGQGWVHALCSVFMPELTYSDAAHLRIVEGISIIPEHRWTTKCSLCNLEGGAVVKCGNCPKEYHISCAWKFGHKFGFEIQPIKSSRRDMTSIVTFKKETGAMNAVICCKDHVSYRRQTYDLCDTNEAGESALQLFSRTYKQAETNQSHSLLRKAQRLDQLLHALGLTQSETSSVSSGIETDGPSTPNGSSAPAKPECKVCSTQFSPFFHKTSSEVPGDFMCHRCYFKTEKEKEKGKGREDSMEGSTTPEVNGLNGLNGGPNGISGSDTSIKPDQNGIEKTDVVISVA